MKCVGDNFDRFCRQHQSKDVITISNFRHQHSKIVTTLKSLTFTCHQYLCNLRHEMKYLGMKNGIGKTRIQEISKLTQLFTSARGQGFDTRFFEDRKISAKY